MRRTLLLIGLILLPQTAAADALSPWAQEVLERADAGILSASSSPASACDEPSKIQEIRNNLSVVRDERNIVLDLGIESEMLRDRTLCLESDRQLLLSKMQEAYEAMNQATVTCNLHDVRVLRDVYAFLVTAYRMFLRGSVDSSFSGTLLRYDYPFETGRSGSPSYNPTSLAPLCPYTTDYGPHAIGRLTVDEEPVFGSYGCDADVLEEIRSGLSPALQIEANDLLDFQMQAGTLSSTVYGLVRQAIANIETTIASLTGGAPPEPLPPVADPPPHRTIAGCLLPESPEPVSGAPADAAVFHAVLSAFPDFFRPENLRFGGTADATYTPADGNVLPFGVLFRPSFDSFLLLPSTLNLMRGYDDRTGLIGADRPFPRDLKIPPEADMSLAVYVNATKAGLRSLQAETERSGSLSLSILGDSYERTLEAARPLRSAVSALADVTGKFLPDEYIPSVAYFLRRSCVDGHCAATLDSVAKRTFNPYCHPYVSGLYTDELAAKKCYCDPSVESEWDDFDTYCSGTYSESDYAELEAGDGEPILCGDPSIIPPPASSGGSSSQGSIGSSASSL